MADPILWCYRGARGDANRRVPAKKFNPETRQMEDVFDEETGGRVFERVPQRPHVAGDYDNPELAKRGDWLHVLRHDGHVVRMKLTNAAADRDLDAPGARERRAKARHLGWIPVGHCPLVLLISRELQKGQLAARHLLEEQACQPGEYSETKPCRHYLVEEAARRARNLKEQTKLARKHQSEAEKMIAAQREQTGEIVTAITEAMKSSQPTVSPDLISAVVAATVAALKEQTEAKPKR